VVGPTNLVAFLSSLQMGFRTLAVEKRSSEVWALLGQVKTEFGKFADVLESVKKKLAAATNEIDKVETRTNAINRRLRKVQDLPAGSKAGSIKALPEAPEELDGVGGAVIVEALDDLEILSDLDELDEAEISEDED